jgi:hypothetical protein
VHEPPRLVVTFVGGDRAADASGSELVELDVEQAHWMGDVGHRCCRSYGRRCQSGKMSGRPLLFVSRAMPEPSRAIGVDLEGGVLQPTDHLEDSQET